MDVLHITTQQAPHFKEQIRGLESQGVNCDVIAASEKKWIDKTVNPIEEIFHGHNILWYGYSSLKLYPNLLRKTLNRDYDIIHVNNGMVAPFAFFQNQRPIVITFWGSDVQGHRLFGVQPHISQICAKYSSANIVMNENMKEYLGTDAKVISLGVDIEKFVPKEKNYCLEKLGWDKNKYHVLFPYPPEREVKNYPLARQAVSMVNHNIEFELELQTMNNVNHSEVPIYMNGADLLLLTSKHEGSPNTVKEAMACNLPIVSTDVGDVRQQLKGVSPSVISNHDATELAKGILHVLESDSVPNSRGKVKPLETVADQIIEVYTKCLGDEYK